MTLESPPPARRPSYLRRVIRAHWRLAVSTAFGVVVALLLPSAWPAATRFLIGWDADVAFYLVLVFSLMWRSEAGHIGGHAADEDEGRIVVLVLTVIAAMASVGAIVSELSTGQAACPSTCEAKRTAAQLALATTTIVLSWTFIHTIFALHYAHDYYGDHGAKKHGLDFKGEDQPDYWDFVYFSFVIGMTSQVSDVTIKSRPIRRIATAHSIVSFFFNVTLLALMVNIAASAI